MKKALLLVALPTLYSKATWKGHQILQEEPEAPQACHVCFRARTPLSAHCSPGLP